MKIIYGFLFLSYLTLCTANYHIEKLDNSSGLLYVPQGKVLFREDHWNILVYADISVLYDQIHLIADSYILLDKICDIKDCPMVDIVRFYFQEFIESLDLFTSQPIFDDYGFPYFFTGLPDESLRKKVTKMINVHEKNETIQPFLDDNFYLTKLDMSDFDSSNSSNELKGLYDTNQKLFNNLVAHSIEVNSEEEEYEEVFELMETLAIALLEWIEKFDIITESLQLAQADVLNYEILNVPEFIDLLEDCSEYIHKDLKYPFEPTDENGIALLNTIDLKTMIFGSKLMFLLTIPLVANEDFDLYNMLPLPVMLSDSSFLYIEPSVPYLAINGDKTKYATMENLNKCFHIGINERLCGGEDIYDARYRPICETELALMKHVPKSCHINMLPNKLDIFSRLGNTNSWLFVKSTPETVEISQNDVALFGSGILSLDPKCQAKTKATTLKANSYSENFVNTIVPKANLLTEPCCNKGNTISAASNGKRSFHDKFNINLNNMYKFSSRVVN